MDTPETPETPARGDDRRSEVSPTDHPVPSNPPVDEEALEKAEENLGRVKPY